MNTAGDSRREQVQEHIRRYQASDGEDGHIWNGAPTLLLTTTGRQSGAEFTTPLVYGRSSDGYVVVASRGGAVTHPKWFLNIRAIPEVKVQVAAEKFRATARIADANERAELWSAMTKIWPRYEEYQQNTEREIPVVVLERL